MSQLIYHGRSLAQSNFEYLNSSLQGNRTHLLYVEIPDTVDRYRDLTSYLLVREVLSAQRNTHYARFSGCPVVPWPWTISSFVRCGSLLLAHGNSNVRTMLIQ